MIGSSDSDFTPTAKDSRNTKFFVRLLKKFEKKSPTSTNLLDTRLVVSS